MVTLSYQYKGMWRSAIMILLCVFAHASHGSTSHETAVLKKALEFRIQRLKEDIELHATFAKTKEKGEELVIEPLEDLIEQLASAETEYKNFSKTSTPPPPANQKKSSFSPYALYALPVIALGALTMLYFAMKKKISSDT